MRAARITIAALGLGLLSSSAWAQFGGPPPVSSYTVNVVVETPKGEVIHKGAVKCKTLTRCEGPETKMTVAGTPRTFSITVRWDGMQLNYECNFLLDTTDLKKRLFDVSRPSGKLVLKNEETGEKLLYDTRNGIAWKGMPEFEKGAVAKVRVEVRT